MLVNLIGNAIKFTSAGYVLVDVSGHEAPDGSAAMTVRVEDTGIGIPPEMQQHIFDKFTQAESSTTRQYGGTGLGLAICRELVRMMGGELQVESQEGVGSTFFFAVLLPVAEAPKASSTPQVDLSEARMLVVDDVAVNRTILREHLRVWGVALAEAASGEEALHILRTAVTEHRPYPVVITDYMMPQMDGLQLAAAMREDARLNDTLILMASSAAHIDRSALEHVGIAALLLKPLRSSQLHETLCTLWAAWQRGETVDL